MATNGATGDCAGMSQIWSVRAHNAVEPKHSTAGTAERHAGVMDAADPATRERDEVDDCGVASFLASDPPSWWSRGVTSGAREGRRAWLPHRLPGRCGLPCESFLMWATTVPCAAGHENGQ